MEAGRWWVVAIVLALSAGLLLASWLEREADRQARDNATQMCVQNRMDSHPDWTSEQCLLICQNKVWVGMTPEQARASWGNPSSIQEVVVGSRTYERWEYGGWASLTFESGALSDYESDWPDT